jgi:hypothetical protein
MLSKSPTTRCPTISFAWAGHCAVRLVGGLKCPHCARQLRATDVELDFGDVRLVCNGCFRDVLTIGDAP